MNDDQIYSNITTNNYNNIPTNSHTTTFNNSSKTINDYIEQLPQNYLIISVLILFLILFLILVITLACLLKRRKKQRSGDNLFNNIDVHKIVIKNPNNIEKSLKKENIKDFQAVQNNSSVGDTIQPNMTLGEIKEKNLKEEVHNIISGTLTELSLNKSKKFAQRKKGSSSRRNRVDSAKLANNNIIFSPKEFAEDKKYGTNINI